MSVRYLKDYGYPCDLELSVSAEPGKRPIICVEINGIDEGIDFATDEPSSARRAFANGFFAGINFMEKR